MPRQEEEDEEKGKGKITSWRLVVCGDWVEYCNLVCMCLCGVEKRSGALLGGIVENGRRTLRQVKRLISRRVTTIVTHT